MNAPIDDLTDKVCAHCGTRFELHRPNSLYYNGAFYGTIVCSDCVPIEHAPVICDAHIRNARTLGRK